MGEWGWPVLMGVYGWLLYLLGRHLGRERGHKEGHFCERMSSPSHSRNENRQN